MGLSEKSFNTGGQSKKILNTGVLSEVFNTGGLSEIFNTGGLSDFTLTFRGVIWDKEFTLTFRGFIWVYPSHSSHSSQGGVLSLG